jgi:hypothetical protein
MDATARIINNVNEITILHVRSSGPRGRAGLEYKKCLENCERITGKLLVINTECFQAVCTIRVG